jgi:polyisoprenoid-binding protein YceI
MVLRLALSVLLSVLTIGTIGGKMIEVAETMPQNVVEKSDSSKTIAAVQTGAKASSQTTATRYRINTRQSQFTVHAYRGGLLWLLGHDHIFAVRDFTGEAQATPGTLTPASFEIRVKADSLAETQAKFTEQQKQMINDATHKQVLETSLYPEITFKSTDISTEKTSENDFKAKIGGDLTLHGVTRHIVIPAQVKMSRDTLHASGEFSVDRSDYKVKTKSIKGGTIGMRDKVKFSFDIVAASV